MLRIRVKPRTVNRLAVPGSFEQEQRFSSMTRKVWAVLFLAVAAAATIAFYVLLAEPTISDAEIAVSAIATLAAGWGIALLLADRFSRWAIRYMAVISPIVIVFAFVMTRAVPG